MSIKDVRSQGDGSGCLSIADIFRTRGFLQMRTSALFGVKTSNFWKFMVCSHGQGEGIKLVRTSGEGVNFARTSFMDCPLL